MKIIIPEELDYRSTVRTISALLRKDKERTFYFLLDDTPACNLIIVDANRYEIDLDDEKQQELLKEFPTIQFVSAPSS